MSRRLLRPALAAGATVLSIATAVSTLASSHPETPFITEMPKVDGTDFYLFRSYESSREGFVTLIANSIWSKNSCGLSMVVFQ